MDKIRQSKRKRAESEDSSGSDFENEMKNKPKKRNASKKKAFIESESESEAETDSSVTAKNNESENEKCQTSDEDDDEPINKMVNNSHIEDKSKEVNASSDSSDNEPLAAKKTNYTNSDGSGCQTSDEDEPLCKVAHNSQLNGKSKKVTHSSDSSNEDSPVSSRKDSPEKIKNNESDYIKSESEENRSDATSEVDDFEISNVKHKSMKVQSSSDSSDDEPLASKISVKQKNVNAALSKGMSRQVQTSSDSSDDEPLANKKSAKGKNGYVSSDEDEPLSKKVKTSSQKNSKIKEKNTTNDRIEHLKKYLRLSGIHINSYDKLFADCKSMKAKTEKLLSILHEKGMKGRPTIEKCKKLKKKIETKKEISELDTSNIIKTEGRPKRGSGDKIPMVKKNESSPVQKRFSRLRDIIDSEESE